RGKARVLFHSGHQRVSPIKRLPDQRRTSGRGDGRDGGEDSKADSREKVEETVDKTGGNLKKALSGAATYRFILKVSGQPKWPFITIGTNNSYYWCSVCGQENSCVHQGVTDVNRHIKSQGHQAKEPSTPGCSLQIGAGLHLGLLVG
ncbi:hypothetical protein PO909_025440, partial [Leuciscus waleckii]